MKKRIIWSNMNLELKDYQDYFEEEGITDENEQHEAIYDLNYNYLEDERINFGAIKTNKILAIADLGLWNGRKQGYKIFNELSDIFYADCDYVEWYVDQYNLRATMEHHDGTNYMLYREIRENRNIENFTDMIYNGKEIDNKTLNYYTKSLRKPIAKLYGW